MQFELSAFRLEPATRVVSLGGRSATSDNLKRYFGVDDEFPFDYWVTDPQGVASLIQEGEVANLYDPDQLYLTAGRVAVKHRRLGIQFHQDFPRERGPFIFEPVVRNFREYIDYARHVTQTRFYNLFQLDRSNERILFVRENNHGHELEMALRTRFTRATWCLATVSGAPEDAVNGWRGDPEVWNRAFSELGVGLRTPKRAPRAYAA